MKNKYFSSSFYFGINIYILYTVVFSLIIFLYFRYTELIVLSKS